jgi:hypothetical protein
MGFLSGLGRLVSGKPMFTPDDVAARQQGGAVDTQQTLADGQSGVPQPAAPVDSAPRPTPIVRVGRVDCHFNGDRMEVWAHIKNESAEELYMDKIILFGVTHQLDRPVKAGDSYQFRIYTGPVLTQQPDELGQVLYRNMARNDYHSAHHVIHYKRQDDGRYIITELRLQLPIYDLQY